MVRAEYFAAVDLGASSGRVMLGRWDGARIVLEERHRFANGPVSVGGHRYWDALHLWDEIRTGLAGSAERTDGRILGVGVDSWGVDFALLDRDGRLVGNPYHYRDRRTDGIPELVYERVSRAELFAETGIQPMRINTLFPLFAMVRAGDPQLQVATTLLPMPNLFSHWLGGVQAAEYTHATTTGCLSARSGRWATELLGSLGIPPALFPAVAEPGTVLGTMRSTSSVAAAGTTCSASSPRTLAVVG